MLKTIKIGIDLGTTNSEIAVKNNQRINLIKNIEGAVFTPSVFGIDEEGNKLVGEKAYHKRFIEGKEENYRARVKRLMGSKKNFDFPRSSEDFGPEEVSAEILKNLKTDVLREHPDFNTVAAVITIPAYFDRLQAEATKRAGKKAGFEYVILLQEPIAASMSYGFRKEKDENWLGYDLGGGTFDAALVSSIGGSLSVLSHNGDNFLGGDDFDDLIIEEIIIPEIADKVGVHVNEISLSKRERLTLKDKAKSAKEKLSDSEEVTVQIQDIFHQGEEVVFDRLLNRDEFNRLISSIVKKTIKISKRTIEESGVNSEAIDKIILVGGSTRIPYIQKELEDKLRIEVDSSGDPITAVAKGACIYGGSKKVPEEFTKKNRERPEGSYDLELNYDPSTTEEEETIGGRVKSLKKEKKYFIQIKSEDGMYSGSKKKLKADGTFLETLSIEKNKTNKFLIYLYDDQGNSLDLSPNSFEIIHGISSTGTPLPRSVGVGVTKGLIEKDEVKIGARVDFLFEKGESLPLEITKEYKTVRGVKKDSDDSSLSITVYEGESNIPEHNTFICDVEIMGKDLEYNLPKGEEAKVTIIINESSELVLEAYFPAIDLHIQNQDKLRTKHDKKVEVKKLEEDIEEKRKNFKKLEDKCTTEEKDEIEELINEIDKDLKNTDSEERAKKAEDRLKELKQKVAGLKSKKEFPELEQNFNLLITEIQNLINDLKSSSEIDEDELMEELNQFKEKGQKAISSQNNELLNQLNRNLIDFRQKVLSSSSVFWAELFRRVANREISDFDDPAEARRLIKKGREFQNINELKECVRGLFQLLPLEDQFNIEDSLPDITLK